MNAKPNLFSGNEDFKPTLGTRKVKAHIWNAIFLFSTMVGVLSLVTIVWSILDSCFGYVVTVNSIAYSDIDATTDKKFQEQGTQELLQAIKNAIDADFLTQNRLEILEQEKPLGQRSADELRTLIVREVLQPVIKKSWNLTESLFSLGAIQTLAKEKYPDGELSFRTWLSPDFLAKSQSQTAEQNGVRGAIVGSLWTILIAILIAFPIGIGSAIYLEEYAKDGWLNRFIQTNIYNLAGVPSIIYGMLGLAIFVRAMEPVTSGSLFGVTDVNGRTVFSAGLTLGILILPIIIINAQEALKAIPNSLRYSSYGVGATKWQTIWHHVLPAALDRILTGTVFGISRAIGETAPLVVVGASAFLTLDPSGFFSKFTTLPMQVYTWSQQPQGEFRHIAAAAIIVLMILLLGLNTVAIILRNRIKKTKDAL